MNTSLLFPEQLFRYLPLFVYGTLKPGGANYRNYLAGCTLVEQPAILRRAALFTDGRYPYLVTDPALVEPRDQVHGILVEVAPSRYPDTLRRIDWLEDFKPHSPWSLYLRTSTFVELAEGTGEAWLYEAGAWITASVRAGGLRKIPDGVWGTSGAR